MDSYISKAAAPKSKLLTINTTNHSSMVSSKTLPLSPPYTTFRSSPLNPSPSPPPTSNKLSHPSRRSPTFPASRPIRPFPSISQSLAGANTVAPEFIRPEAGVLSPKSEEGSIIATGKRSPKIIEISSKWRGGFLVLSMTQAEFSRKD